MTFTNLYKNVEKFCREQDIFFSKTIEDSEIDPSYPWVPIRISYGDLEIYFDINDNTFEIDKDLMECLTYDCKDGDGEFGYVDLHAITKLLTFLDDLPNKLKKVK